MEFLITSRHKIIFILSYLIDNILSMKLQSLTNWHSLLLAVIKYCFKVLYKNKTLHFQSIINPLKTKFFFHRYSRYNLREVAIVYRFIGNFFNDPFLFKIEIKGWRPLRMMQSIKGLSLLPTKVLVFMTL